jgi:hypothetical protein
MDSTDRRDALRQIAGGTLALVTLGTAACSTAAATSSA